MRKIARWWWLCLWLVACSAKPVPVAEPPVSFPINVVGGDEASFAPTPSGELTRLERRFDVIVIGGGIAGLSSAVFVSKHRQSVLLLEKESTLGGLAQGTTFPGSRTRYDRGAAYWTNAYREEMEILKEIGLGDYARKFPIPEPIDSYLWNGKFYRGIWEPHTLAELPASFALFHQELQAAMEAKLIGDQPIEESANLELDRKFATDWIRGMPASAAARKGPEGEKVYARFQADLASGRLKRGDPMADVIGLMELFCRSALGTTPDQLSAMAFANFYISEIETRFTSVVGTGKATELMANILKARRAVRVQTRSTVAKVENFSDRVDVTYVQGGKSFVVSGNYVIFAAQLPLAPKLIAGFADAAPEQARLMRELKMANYAVHALQVKGHPFRDSYDTWIRPADYSEHDFTDLILGRWMEPRMLGYEGYRDFRKNPPGDAIVTLYHHLPLESVGAGFSEDQAKELARRAVRRMQEVMRPMQKDGPYEVKAVQTSRWPYSVHVVEPGHFTHKAKILRRPFGRIYFANNNMGTPAFEEALFRGHCAAVRVLMQLRKGFQREAWSRCPLE